MLRGLASPEHEESPDDSCFLTMTVSTQTVPVHLRPQTSCTRHGDRDAEESPRTDGTLSGSGEVGHYVPALRLRAPRAGFPAWRTALRLRWIILQSAPFLRLHLSQNGTSARSGRGSTSIPPVCRPAPITPLIGGLWSSSSEAFPRTDLRSRSACASWAPQGPVSVGVDQHQICALSRPPPSFGPGRRRASHSLR